MANIIKNDGTLEYCTCVYCETDTTCQMMTVKNEDGSIEEIGVCEECFYDPDFQMWLQEQ